MDARILFRVDASGSIGLGHLTRCAALADAFTRAGASCEFLTTTPEAVGPRVSQHELLPLAAEAGSNDDAGMTSRLARQRGFRHVIVDGYVFGAAWARALGLPSALWIDDLGFDDRRGGYVVNHHLYATPARYPAMPPERLLLGPAFALLRPEFAAAREEQTTASVVPRILITMGGADPPGATLRAVEAVSALRGRQPIEVRILVGAANPRRDELSQLPDVDVVVDARDVASHLRWSDVVVTAAGGTALELSCVGVPAVVLTIADNQRDVAKRLAEVGLVRNLGWHEDVSPTAIADAVDELLRDGCARTAMVAAQRATVDGRGAERVVNHLLERTR
jgi:UDP-2,4-diacetamido-2,4,6-trideoxy-beta-L-altropyranose hydrolase